MGGKEVWERQGSEAGSPPALVVLLLEAGVRGVREEGGESEKETRMKQEMEEQREVQELWVLEESQGEELEGRRDKKFNTINSFNKHIKGISKLNF